MNVRPVSFEIVSAFEWFNFFHVFLQDRVSEFRVSYLYVTFNLQYFNKILYDEINLMVFPFVWWHHTSPLSHIWVMHSPSSTHSWAGGHHFSPSLHFAVLLPFPHSFPVSFLFPHSFPVSFLFPHSFSACLSFSFSACLFFRSWLTDPRRSVDRKATLGQIQHFKQSRGF